MSLPSRFSVATDGEEPPLKKKASLLLLPQTTISSLPDDLILSCLARVSRLYYPTLSLVSKKFRLLLASPELYEARSLLGCTETCLYVCLRFDRESDPDLRWFTLSRKPSFTSGKKKKKKSIGYVLATIPIPQSPPAYSRGVVALGSNIYTIGESSYNAQPLSNVSILDCKSHTWHKAPSMQVKRNFANANVFDGKIYVSGGCGEDNNDSSSNWMEVFDPKTQTWESLFCPVAERCNQVDKSAVIDGEIYMFGNCKGLAYKPKEHRWTWLGGMTLMDIGWVWFAYCMIDNVLYCYSKLQREIMWYDFNLGFWVNLKGLKGLPEIPKYSCVRLVSYGGKMAVLWDKNLTSSNGAYKKIWCAVIALEKRNNNEEIWGNVESLDDDVLTVPSSYKFACALAVTV